MKSRLIKLALTLCTSWILGFAVSAYAQDTNGNEVPHQPAVGRGGLGFGGRDVDNAPEYDIQIENGSLSLAPVKGRPEVKATWGPGDLASVSATVGNLAKYLRIVNTNLNLVVSTDATDVRIGDLKIHSTLNALMEALSVATDGNVHGRGNGRSGASLGTWFIVAERPAIVSRRTVEVFNLSGYIKTLGDVKEEAIRAKLDEIQLLTVQTLENLYQGRNIENPSFRFHSGTSLLIVTGDSDCIDVARKIINALPGQQKYGREDLLLDVTAPSGQK